MMMKLFRSVVTMIYLIIYYSSSIQSSDLLITSGVAVEELDGRSHELGQLRLGNVLLSIQA